MEKDRTLFHRRVWRVLYPLLHPWLCRKFNLTHTQLAAEGPCLIVPNHVCAWDPLLVSMCLREKQTYFVASEHLFRKGLVTKLLQWLVAPIPRWKASSGVDTVKACLKHLKAGHSVCLFAEGEQTWDGRTAAVFPATGKLAKRSGASLVTMRIEGGYLSLPRWGRGVRRGRVHVSPVNVYTPAQLEAMTPQEVNEAIARDIREDAWLRQEKDPAAFRGKRLAEGLERALFLCPDCEKIGMLRTKDDRITCACGLSLRYEETGFFSPDTRFRTIADWDAWQHRRLRELAFPENGPLFSDPDLILTRVKPDHSEETVGRGELAQFSDRLVCVGKPFPMAEIQNMAMVQANRLLFSCGDSYWQIFSDNNANLRKYLELWKER